MRLKGLGSSSLPPAESLKAACDESGRSRLARRCVNDLYYCVEYGTHRHGNQMHFVPIRRPITEIQDSVRVLVLDKRLFAIVLVVVVVVVQTDRIHSYRSQIRSCT
jgi:hypothetical protein